MEQEALKDWLLKNEVYGQDKEKEIIIKVIPYLDRSDGLSMQYTLR